MIGDIRRQRTAYVQVAPSRAPGDARPARYSRCCQLWRGAVAGRQARHRFGTAGRWRWRFPGPCRRRSSHRRRACGMFYKIIG